jgi:hypothetical protein
MHDENKEKWPAIFGKLYADHFHGVMLQNLRPGTQRINHRICENPHASSKFGVCEPLLNEPVHPKISLIPKAYHVNADREPKQWTRYSTARAASTLSLPQSPDERKAALVKQLLAARGNTELQEELVLELHNSVLNAEKMIANLQGGKRQAQHSRDSVKALMNNRNMDLLKVRLHKSTDSFGLEVEMVASFSVCDIVQGFHCFRIQYRTQLSY